MEKERIKDFLTREVLSNKNIGAVGDTDNLIEMGVIDSLSILSLVSYLEKEFGIKIDDMDLMPDNFETIESICALVRAKSA